MDNKEKLGRFTITNIQPKENFKKKFCIKEAYNLFFEKYQKNFKTNINVDEMKTRLKRYDSGVF